jgi:hypothetical protein
MNLNQCKGDNGKLIEWAWPGGYPITYICADGGTVCPECAQKYLDKAANLQEDDFLYKWEVVIGGDIYHEGPTIQCEECNTLIESAYGDPDDDRVSANAV